MASMRLLWRVGIENTLNPSVHLLLLTIIRNIAVSNPTSDSISIVPYSCIKGTMHIFGLSAILIAFPIYSQLLENSAYFVVNRIEKSTLIAFVLLISIGVPSALCLALFLLQKIHDKLYWWAHLLVIGLLFSFTFIPLIDQLTQSFLSPYLTGEIKLILGLIISAVGVYHYAITPVIYKTLSYSGPLFLVVLVYFSIHPKMTEVYTTQENYTSETVQFSSSEELPPIVMIVYDALPTVALLGANGNIDQNRFPNFAAFSAQSTWYPHSTTVHDFTLKAIPAILNGKFPNKENNIPVSQHYPNNLFSLLKNEYTIHALETSTRLHFDERDTNADDLYAAKQKLLFQDALVIFIHAVYPKDLANNIIPIEEGIWGGFMTFDEVKKEKTSTDVQDLGKHEKLRKDAQESFNSWWEDMKVQWDEEGYKGLGPAYQHIKDIPNHPKQTFHFMHIIVPHPPFDTLPSGRKFNSLDISHYKDSFPPHEVRWFRHSHLIKTGLADKILGDYVQILNDAEIFDDALIIITADHGIAFGENIHGRRLEKNNFAPIAFTPLLIKYPKQSQGHIDESNAQTIDIAPTILDAIGAEHTLKLDGRSLLNSQASIPDTKNILSISNDEFTFSFDDSKQLHHALKQEYKTELALDHPLISLYNIGPGLDYLNQTPEQLQAQTIPSTIESPSPALFQTIDLNALILPVRVEGAISMYGSHEPNSLIVGIIVNGKIDGVTVPYLEEGVLRFNHILPEQTLLPGNNSLEFLLLPKNSSENN